MIDLRWHEQQGGHTIARHVGKNLSWLYQRLTQNPTIRQATSFDNCPAAEKFIYQAIQANHQNFLTWRNSSRTRLPLNYDAGTNVGYGLVRGASQLMQMTKLSVVLTRIQTNTNESFILTAYPTP